MRVELIAVTPDPEKLIEQAGRTSYLSFDRQSEGSEKKFIKMIIKRGHTSVLEHASATFRISGVSRALTHQLVRHRFSSITQQSQRYVDETNFDYVEPDDIKVNPKTHRIFTELMERIKLDYKKLRNMRIRKEDARFILPNATKSELVISANFREWRHIIELRGDPAAQWEIRELTVRLLEELKKKAPTVFGDFIVNEEKDIVRVKEEND
ncbi:MAG: Flavin-dependent thymidylate synthase [Promethearchaeota archaeon]|nr:MAG: Flavin-dependent thymidylate synthase [Candidatus Lokiarchaeota archaeon]